jgi:hypothetical protein
VLTSAPLSTGERVMFEKLFGRRRRESGSSSRMPEVDEVANIEEVFTKARKAAAGEESPEQKGRNVIIVTPGRMLMLQPCPAPGSMASSQVATVEGMIPAKVKRNVAAIAYAELSALRADISKTIPFFGILLGFSYIGHAVWVFEGHASALAAGCKDANVLIVDGEMVPHLQTDWVSVASSAMKNREIYIHDRVTYSLRKAT